MAIANACLIETAFASDRSDSQSGETTDSGDATIVRAGRVAPQILRVTIREGRVIRGKLLPYQNQPGDEIQVVNLGHTRLIRDGKTIGNLTGTESSTERWVCTEDSFVGRAADRQRLTDPAAWSIDGPTGPIQVTDVYRKSHVKDIADYDGRRPDVCFEHSIYLAIASPLPTGKVVIRSKDPVIQPYSWSFDPAATMSDAIHVTTIGFRPDDPLKMGVLSCWMGDGGGLDYRTLESYSDGLPEFALVDVETDRVATRGRVTLIREPDQPGDHRGVHPRPDGTAINYAGTPTFAIDFSSVTDPGHYQIVVQGIGASRPFPIGREVYRPIRDLAIEGLAAHRWGENRSIMLSDGTRWNRPAAVPATDRSDDNVPIFRTSAVYTNANFADFEPGNLGPWKPTHPTDTVVGGYMDAGDFDRNHNHFIISYLLLDAAEKIAHKDPALIGTLVEAATWNVDLYLRLQDDSGGVPSAIEYAEHPKRGEPSWLNSLPLYVCAPSRESCLNFAIMAAKTASTLNTLGRDGGQVYRDAAVKALEWYRRSDPSDMNDPDTDFDHYSFALAETWRATNDETYRRELLDGWSKRIEGEWSVVYPNGLSALMTVLEMPDSQSRLDASTVKRLVGSAQRTLQVNYLDGSSDRSAFRILKNGWVNISWGNGSWPTNDAANVLRAWRLFGDEAYLSAAVAGFAYACGGNPNNLVYMTGVNDRSVQNILHCDTRYSGVAPPAGIPIYGPALPAPGDAWPLNWHLHGDQTIYPEYAMWPAYENVHEYWNWGVLMEYTTHQNSSAAIYFATLLDQLDRSAPK